MDQLDPKEKSRSDQIREERQAPEEKIRKFFGTLSLHKGHKLFCMDKNGEVTEQILQSSLHSIEEPGQMAPIRRFRVKDTNPENLYLTALNLTNAKRKFKQETLKRQKP